MTPSDRTLFQESEPPDSRFDLQTDAAIAYGIDDTLAGRIEGWRHRGYRVHVMTGLAWGDYREYLLGHWDGDEHWDEAQYRADGRPRQHGPAMPYMVPSRQYGAYLEDLLRRAIDAGAEAIFLEEPEFWADAKHGPGFERAWQVYHGGQYRDPSSGPEAYVRGAEVQYALYGDLIARLCRAVKRHSQGRVPCYVATHSLLNYAHNRIVSPEHSLRRIPECDGMILQVWSQTAHSPTLYEGRTPDGVFAVAFLEYGSGFDLVRGSGRRLWFLADPVEDSPQYGWDRYRRGYETTIVASLLHPEVGGFEVMPWPARVFTRRYPRRPGGPEGEQIPARYAQEVLAVANALSAMPDGPLEWDCGTRGIGVLVADSLMFRRGGPAWDDPMLSAFYGLALPPVFAGMPARPVSLEALAEAGVPDGMCLLLLSYDGMTPPGPEAHDALARWVRSGGALIQFGSGDGPYGTLPGWWNEAGAGTPSDGDAGERAGPWADLHRRIGLPPAPAPGAHRAGNGIIWIEPAGPVALAQEATGAALVRGRIGAALAMLGRAAPRAVEQPYMLLRRGQYLIAAAPRDAVHDAEGVLPLALRGRFVDLLDGELPVLERATLDRGGYLLLIDLDRPPGPGPRVVAASARIGDERVEGRALRFRAAGPAGTTAVMRLALPEAPRVVTVDGEEVDARWDAVSATALVRRSNRPEGARVAATW